MIRLYPVPRDFSHDLIDFAHEDPDHLDRDVHDSAVGEIESHVTLGSGDALPGVTPTDADPGPVKLVGTGVIVEPLPDLAEFRSQ
jgi:hypothetical protein